jgi:glycosyltransferase involved in cell wall biosynthesis
VNALLETDVAVCTYQSAKYLEQCLSSIEKNVPFNKLIIVDHYSTDGTVEIARRHNAEIYYEKLGLGYARQMAIDHAEAPVLFLVDSDVVFYESDWYPKAVAMVEEECVGAVGIWTPTMEVRWKQRYVDWWWDAVPAMKHYAFTNSYFILRKAIEGIRIPIIVSSLECEYIQLYMQKRGYNVKILQVPGWHYNDYPQAKGSSIGAGVRILYGLRDFPRFLLRRVFTSPIKGIPPAIAYHDPEIITKNTEYWVKYLRGWLQPEKYRHAVRAPEKDTSVPCVE